MTLSHPSTRSDEVPGEVLQRFTVSYAFPVVFTRGVFDPANPSLRDTLRRAGRRRHRVLIAVDSNLAAANPTLLQRLTAYGAAHADTIEWVGAPLVVTGGEACKNDLSAVEALHRRVEQHGIDRQSFVLALGGGAVLDAVGYATATAHRGIRLLRLPTTVLAQNDAGIGVKNGINAFGRKNFIGTFAPPFAVINDFELLRTLPPREVRSGMAEAVKIAVIKDAEFLSWLYRERHALYRLSLDAVEISVERCARLHLAHVAGGDPFELGSARPLDFGHWSAHKLEELTRHTLHHGEAVAIGCALDSIYACRLGLIDEAELERVLQTLEGIGLALYHPELARLDLPQALEQFREHLGGDLCITLPAGLGNKRELREIDVPLMGRCILWLAERSVAEPQIASG